MNTIQTLIIVVLLFVSVQIKAQYRDFMTFGGQWPFENEIDEEIHYQNDKLTSYSIHVTSGLPTGIGIGSAYRLKPRIITRISFHYADLKLTDYKLSFNGAKASQQDFLFDVTVKQSHFAGFVDYCVKPGFRLWGGLQYYLSNTIAVGGELSGIVKFNDVSLNSNDLGSGILTMGFKSFVTPSVGLGFGRLIPKKRMALSLDVGAQYRGNYTFEIQIKEGVLLKKNEENSKILERNFNKNWYQKIFPALQLRLSYNIQYKKIPLPIEEDEQ